MIKGAATVVLMVSMLFVAGCPGGQPSSLTLEDINRISYGTMYAAGYASVASNKIEPAMLTKIVSVLDKVQAISSGMSQDSGGLQANIMPFVPDLITKAGITDPTQAAAAQTFIAVVLKTADTVVAKYPELAKNVKDYAAIVSTVIQGAKAGINDASKFNSKAPLPAQS